MSDQFPDRASIKANKINIVEKDFSFFPERETLYSSNNIEEDGFNRDLQIDVLEKQKIYLWTRIYLKQELELKAEELIKIKYTPNNEEITLKFICYNKKGLNKDSGDEMVDYNNEDDKSVLCLQSDLDIIDNNSDDIPFIRTLFKKSKWYQQQIFRKDELVIEYNGNTIDYIFIDF